MHGHHQVTMSVGGALGSIDELGLQLLAVAAPRRKELDQPEVFAGRHLRERALIKVDNLGRRRVETAAAAAATTATACTAKCVTAT
jgi:hypothetical protein